MDVAAPRPALSPTRLAMVAAAVLAVGYGALQIGALAGEQRFRTVAGVTTRPTGTALKVATSQQDVSRRTAAAALGLAGVAVGGRPLAPALAATIEPYADFDKYVKLEVLKPGNGKDFPAPGQTVEVHYVGTLLDGTKFDSSRDRGRTFKFPIAAGRVIKGWDAAVSQMSVGERVLITIQPDWAYGSRGIGPIPPNAALVFDVELIAVGV
jgi:FK506-binding protein 1